MAMAMLSTPSPFTNYRRHERPARSSPTARGANTGKNGEVFSDFSVRCSGNCGIEKCAARSDVGAPLLPSSSRRVFQSRLCRAASGDGEEASGAAVSEAEGEEGIREKQEAGEGAGRSGEGMNGARRKTGEARVADSTDWISSSLTRRFGFGAGLAWVGVLAFGVISEQVKTRTEVFREEQGTRDVQSAKEVVLPNGISYVELREGGGTSPQRGDLVLIDLTGKVKSTGEVFVDTTAKDKRSVAFVFGAKPYSGGMCDGLEDVLRSMKVGGKRRVVIPPALGYGATGATLNSGSKIPGNATLEYVVQLQRASIAPS